MRIYTRTVWEWQGDQLVLTEADSHEYTGPVAHAKGGGGGAPENYENLERLYGIQADQAEFLGGTFKNTVAPAYKSWLGEAQDYGSQANQEQAAERAGKEVSGATSQAQQALQENMASMGLNPNDPRYQAQIAQMGIQGAGQQAAASTTARESVRDKGFARMQDAIGMGMGTPTQASQAANSAANSANASLTAQNQAQQNQSNSVGNIVRAGTNVWGAYNDTNKADGGEIRKNGIIRLKDGGYVSRQHLKAGGFAGGSTPGGGAGGFMSTPQITAPPPRRPPPPPTGGEQAAGAATSSTGMKLIQTGAGKAIETGGNAAGSPYAASLGRGLQLSPAEARTGAEAYKGAQIRAEQAVDKAMGNTKLSGPGSPPTEVPGTPGAEELTQLSGPGTEVGAEAAGEAGAQAAGEVGAQAAGEVGAEAGTEAAAAAAQAAAAEEAAALAATEGAGLAAGEAGAGLAAGAAIGTAVPAIGAGLALYGIGNAAGWWADGGAVQPGGPPEPAARNDNWKWSDPAWGINKLAKDKGWWADGGDVTPGSKDQTGDVSGPGGPKDDEVLAALSDGEFVMPVGAVKYYGIDRLEKMRQKGLAHEKQMGIT
jgi:hypothetical protein